MPFKYAPTIRHRHEIHGPENSESQHQQALISWARDTAKMDGSGLDDLQREALMWLHHIPNASGKQSYVSKSGRRMAPLQAIKAQAEGLVSGINDLRLDYVLRDSSGHITCPGLIAEMKKAKEKLKPQQKAYQEFMMRQGFAAYTWFTWQRAAYDIAIFMNLERFAPIHVITGDKLQQIGSLEVLKACPLSLF